MNNRKCIGSNPRGDIFLDIGKGKMKYKGFLPSTILYKRSYVLKVGSCCQGGRRRCVCFEMWRRSLPRWQTGRPKEESEEFKTRCAKAAVYPSLFKI